MIDVARWIIGLVFIGVSSLAIFANFIMLVLATYKKRHYSFIPVIGSIAGILGVLVTPDLQWKWMILPVLGDFSTLGMIIHFGSELIRKGKIE